MDQIHPGSDQLLLGTPPPYFVLAAGKHELCPGELPGNSQSLAWDTTRKGIYG